MADRDFQNDGVPEITRKEHVAKNVEAKRSVVYGYNANTDQILPISTVDNGDGTYSLSTSSGAAAATTTSLIDTGNSTSTPLTSNGVFTGASVDVSGYESVTVQLISDKQSATDGLRFESSNDNTNWDHVHSYTYSSSEAGTGIHFEESLPGKYFRIKYTNTNSAQTYFRLQTKLYTGPASVHVHALDETLYTGHPAPITRAVITGQTTAGGGALVNVKVNPSGTLETNSNLKVGGSDVSNSVPVPISDAGGSVTVDATNLDIRDLSSATDSVSVPGVATAANQTTANSTLSSLNTNIAYQLAPGKLRYTNVITASTSITPSSGKAIQVIKVQVVPASANSGDVTIYMNFATSTIDVFKGYAGGGYGVFTGAVNEALTITQTGTGSVQVLVDYNEI